MVVILDSDPKTEIDDESVERVEDVEDMLVDDDWMLQMSVSLEAQTS